MNSHPSTNYSSPASILILLSCGAALMVAEIGFAGVVAFAFAVAAAALAIVIMARGSVIQGAMFMVAAVVLPALLGSYSQEISDLVISVIRPL